MPTHSSEVTTTNPHGGACSTPVHHESPVAHHPMTPLELCGFDPVRRPTPLSRNGLPHAITTHQVKGVQTFTGRERSIRIEDWIRDMRYVLESKGPADDRVQFHDIVRHTSGRARDVILNLESRTPAGVSAEDAFTELLEEFGEDSTAASPMTRFYARVQKSGESASDFAISLETLLRRIEDTGRNQGRCDLFGESRDILLSTQFMAGLCDARVRQRLAPMRPRTMAFKDIRAELRIISEEQHREDELLGQRYNLMAHVPAKAADRDHQPKSEPAKASVPTTDDTQTQVTALIKQMEEMKKRHQQEMEALMKCISKEQNPPQLSRPPFTGCFNCGSMRHLARNCPQRQQPTHQSPAVARMRASSEPLNQPTSSQSPNRSNLLN